jgi:Tfp pilus assembly protein PilZ
VKRPKQTRRYRRRTVRVCVEYTGADGPQRAMATTLGAGGMFIATDEPLPVHALLALRFRLEDGGLLHEIEGCVVWANRPEEDHALTCGMGIEFGNPAARGLLARELEGLCDSPESAGGVGDAERETGSSRP